MYFTDDSLLPENQAPLMITAAPYGPMWMPGDITPEQHLPVTWDEQVQAAVDCYNAGATLLHIHVRDPETGHISKNFNQYNDQIGRLRKAVPKMILQLGGSISFAPEPGEEAKFQSYDSRHKLAEVDPKPDMVTVSLRHLALRSDGAAPRRHVCRDPLHRSADDARDGEPGGGLDARLLSGEHQAAGRSTGSSLISPCPTSTASNSWSG